LHANSCELTLTARPGTFGRIIVSGDDLKDAAPAISSSRPTSLAMVPNAPPTTASRSCWARAARMSMAADREHECAGREWPGHQTRRSPSAVQPRHHRGTWIERSSFIGVQASHLKELVIGNFVMRLPLGPGCSST
jgi:hypothetical protein